MVSLNTLKKNFIHKIDGETVSGVKTFSFNPTYMKNTLNLGSNPFTGLSSVKFNNLGGSVISSLQMNQLNQNFIVDTPQYLSILKNGSSVVKFNESGLIINTSINLTYTTIPTLTPYHIGFNYGSSATSYTGNKTIAGTYIAYHSLNSVPLQVGKYLITINAAISGVAQANWTVNPFRVGYTLGTSSTASANAVYPLLTTTPYVFQGVNANFEFNICSIVSITVDQSYLSAYTSNTMPTQSGFTGSIQSGVSSYYVVRIS